MDKYVISKDNGIGKVSLVVKEEMISKIMNFLKEEYGDENVGMVRVGTSSETNEIGVRVGELVEDGFTYDLCMTISGTVKSHKDKITKKYTVPAFDFEYSRENYENYMREKKEKELEKETKKAERRTSAEKKEEYKQKQLEELRERQKVNREKDLAKYDELKKEQEKETETE
jgi:hypothetical protein